MLVRAADIDFEDDEDARGFAWTRPSESGPRYGRMALSVLPSGDFKMVAGTKVMHPAAEQRLLHREAVTTGERATVENDAELTEAQLAEKRSEAELALMRDGRRYEDMQVVITGKHPRKGIVCKVVGDYDDDTRAARIKEANNKGKKLKWDDQEGIMLTLQEVWSGAKISKVKIEDVQHAQ
jgi:hypothetical protein